MRTKPGSQLSRRCARFVQVLYWYSALLILTSAVTSSPISFFTGKSVGRTLADQLRKAAVGSPLKVRNDRSDCNSNAVQI